MKRVTKLFMMCMVFLLMTGFILPAMTMVSVTAENGKGLVAYYKFDQDLKDYSGNGNDGIEGAGKVSYVKAIVGNGASFDGTTYIEVEDSDALDLNTAFTVSLWLYKDGAGPKGNAPILSRGDSSEQDENTPFAVYHDRDGYEPMVRLINSEDWKELQSGVKISPQKWHLLTVTFDSKDVKFYVDGQFKGKQSWGSGELFNTTQKLIIGADPTSTGTLFKGIMDDLRIYNYTQNDAEIKALYEATKVYDTKGKMVAYYKFDQDLKDYSGNTNNGEEAAGKITFMKGQVGNGAKFDGTSYIEVKDNDTIDFDKAFTVSAYIYKTTKGPDGNAPILSRGDISEQTEDTPFALYHDSDGYKPMLRLVNLNDWSEALCSTAVGLNKWYLLTVTFDSKEVKFYIDGVFKNKQTWNGGELFHSTQSLLIGCDPSNSAKVFDGVIDEMKLFNYALTDAEVKSLGNTKNGTIAADTNKYKALAVAPDKAATLKIGQVLPLKVIGTTTQGKNIDVTSFASYKTDNSAIAVAEAGKLIGKSTGTTNITISYGGITKIIKVTVK